MQGASDCQISFFLPGGCGGVCTTGAVVEWSLLVYCIIMSEYILCHFFLDSLSTDSSDFKSAGCRVGKFGLFDI